MRRLLPGWSDVVEELHDGGGGALTEDEGPAEQGDGAPGGQGKARPPGHGLRLDRKSVV